MQLNLKAKMYIAVVCFLAIPIIIFLVSTDKLPALGVIAFWAVLAVVSESLGITLPNGVGVSVSFAISLASIIVGGPLMAIVVSASSFMFRILKSGANKYSHVFNTPIYKTLFNTSQGVIITGISGLCYLAAGGRAGSFSIIPTLITLPCYMLLNITIISVLFTLLGGQSFINIWRNNFRGTFLSSIAIGIIGIIIALAYLSYNAVAVIMFFGPLLLARFSFKLYVDMRNIYIETIQAFNKCLEAKDSYTSGHALRVQEYAVRLAEAMGLSQKQIQNIEKAAILHDIGKVGINDNILRKPTRLTIEEYEEIQRHPSIGAEILKDVDFLKDIAEIIRYHHERYDGNGYPGKLKGNEIPIEASILSIADVYDAMTSNRPYRKSLGHKNALDELKANSGKQFDPVIVTKFIDLMSA